MWTDIRMVPSAGPTHPAGHPGGRRHGAELDAALLLLSRIGIARADLLAGTSPRPPAPVLAVKTWPSMLTSFVRSAVAHREIGRLIEEALT